MLLLCIVLSGIIVLYKLLNINRMQLVTLILTWYHETNVVGRLLNGISSVSTETSPSFVQEGLLVGRSKIYVRYFLQVVYEGEALRAHHLLITAGELEPGVAEDVFGGGTFVWVLLEDSKEHLLRTLGDMVWKRQILLTDVGVKFLVV